MAELRFIRRKDAEDVWVNPRFLVKIYKHLGEWYGREPDGRSVKLLSKDCERLLPNDRRERKISSRKT